MELDRLDSEIRSEGNFWWRVGWEDGGVAGAGGVGWQASVDVSDKDLLTS